MREGFSRIIVELNIIIDQSAFFFYRIYRYIFVFYLFSNSITEKKINSILFFSYALNENEMSFVLLNKNLSRTQFSHRSQEKSRVQTYKQTNERQLSTRHTKNEKKKENQNVDQPGIG